MTIMYGNKSFFFAARTLWNKLPIKLDVNQIVQQDCFKKSSRPKHLSLAPTRSFFLALGLCLAFLNISCAC